MKPDEVELWGDLEGWHDLWQECRSSYSIADVRRDLRRPLGPGGQEIWTDVVLFVSQTLTGQVEDLSEARIWFLERLGIDYPVIDDPEQVAPRSSCTNTPPAVQEVTRPREPTAIAAVTPPAKAKSNHQKITDKPQSTQKSLTSPGRKSPTSPNRKTPPNYVPVVLGVVVVVGGGLETLLRKHGQHEWATRVRMSGLLSLLDFIARKESKDPVYVSGGLARDYVSEFNKPKSESTIRKPLEVLRRIGVIKRVREHAFGRYAKCAAAFTINSDLVQPGQGEPILMNPNNEKKRREAYHRQERRLNSKFPAREQLLKVLDGVRLSPEGLNLALDMSMNCRDEKRKRSLKLIVDLTRGNRRSKIRFTATGHISHTFASCLRELKPHLLLEGSAVSLCDISHAHFCILPRLLLDQIEKARKTGVTEDDLAPLIDERDRLIQFLGDGDFYCKLSSDPDSDEERAWAKARLVKVLNWRNLWTTQDKSYQRLKEHFPETVGVVESIKRFDHKRIQAPLRNLTARAINGALLRLQAQGIPAIPDTDSIICPSDKRDLVCRLIGEEMFRVTGVCCMVDRIRFAPETVRPGPAAVAATPPLIHA